MATTSQKVIAAASTIGVAEAALAMAHTGAVGVIVGLAVGAAAYCSMEDIERVTGRKFPTLPARSEPAVQGNPNHMSLGYRLLHGKSIREQPDGEQALQQIEQRVRQDVGLSQEQRAMSTARPAEEDDLPLRKPQAASGPFTLSHVLKDFTPSLESIYLARLMDGSPVIVQAKHLCHVALAGATGGGKSSLMRLIMAQLCYAGAKVLLLNPHYTRYDKEADPEEDWTPFEPYLMEDPMECRKYETIKFYLDQVANELLPKRLEKYAHSQPLGKPYFIVLDELPAIVRHIPEVPDYLADILREGRKVGIYLITAAQDFLVKTIAPQGGGAIRECYRTAFYVGGDATTAKTLLDMPANQIPESDLGKGVVMLRNAKIKQAQMVRVPYVDNQALYKLLGPSTYRAERTVSIPDDEIYTLNTAKTTVVTPRPEPVQVTTSNLAMQREAILELHRSGKIGLNELVELLHALPEENEQPVTMPSPVYQVANGTTMADLPMRPQQPRLRKELQTALDLYLDGYDSYRKLGEAMEIDKDRAGKLIKELQELGFIEK